MSRTAVVILNYNGEKLLEKFLPSVVQHSHAEIYVVDNNSTDHSIAFIRKVFPSIRVISLDQNYGFCGGYNRGLAQIEADYFLLLNSDIEVTPGWLSSMTDLLDRNPLIAAVQPKVLSYRNKSKFEHAGAGGGFIDSLGYPFCRGRVFDHVESDHGQYNDTREVFWASGACMMIRSEVFRKFGGFDESFFAHMEEIDLCWKLHRAGQQIFYCGDSTVYHVGAGTLQYDTPKKIFLNFRNGLSLIFAHLSTAQLLYKLPLRLMLDWTAAMQFLLKGQIKNSFSVFRAHSSFVGNLKNQISKRRTLMKNYPMYYGKTIYRGSVVVDYFLRRRKDIYVPQMVGNPRSLDNI